MSGRSSRNIILYSFPAVIAIITIVWYRRKKRKEKQLNNNNKQILLSNSVNDDIILEQFHNESNIKVNSIYSSELHLEIEDNILSERTDSSNQENVTNNLCVLLENDNLENSEFLESKCSASTVPENLNATKKNVDNAKISAVSELYVKTDIKDVIGAPMCDNEQVISVADINLDGSQSVIEEPLIINDVINVTANDDNLEDNSTKDKYFLSMENIEIREEILEKEPVEKCDINEKSVHVNCDETEIVENDQSINCNIKELNSVKDVENQLEIEEKEKIILETEHDTNIEKLDSKDSQTNDSEYKTHLDNTMQQEIEETENGVSQNHYSDIRSEGSSDSGKGSSDIQSNDNTHLHLPFSEDGLTVYEFEIPQEYCGRLIGRQGKSVNYIKNHSKANVFIKKHPVNPNMKLCTIEGNAIEIATALELIRRRFPPVDYSDLTLTRFNTTSSSIGGPHIPDTVQLSWLNQSCLLFQKKLLPFHSHFQNASVYHHITEIQLRLPDGIACEVIMSSMVTAGHFFLQQPTHLTYPNLSRLDNYMVTCYTQIDTPQLPRPVEAGVICAAPVMSGWYRAQVVYVCEGMEECDVKFVDYGGYSRVPISSLRQIRSDFMTLPFQAAECYLANVQPCEEEGVWSLEASATFEELAQGHVLQAQVVCYADDNIPYVRLFKTQGISTIFINEELVNRGVAQWIEHN